MESDALLPASALFSPSKARQQRALAQDWAHVDTWLSTRYAGRIPSFERNEDTLRELLALAASNERADDQEELLIKALGDSSGNTNVTQRIVDEDVLKMLGDAMSVEGKAQVEILSILTVALGVSDTDLESVGFSLNRLGKTSQALSQHLLRLKTLQEYLDREISTIQDFLKHTRVSSFQASSTEQRQTSEWTRNDRQLRAKIQEYGERLAGKDESRITGIGQTSIARLVELEIDVRKCKQRIESLRQDELAFNKLPPEVDHARAELVRVAAELKVLKSSRDSLFESLITRRN